MIFAGVRLPDQIRIALEEGRLVIFAGAGISVPPPSGLPSFNALAQEMCGHPVEPGKEDRALGRFSESNPNLHLAVARRLYNPNTQHTQLHRQILRLFGKADKVRVVTTNFDNHFTDAARKVFRGVEVQEYHAPALPLGDDFQGIVYVHGSARVNPRSMVLTDKDFGGAYLTRSWARDFLVYLFSKFSVLFVGYSHSDVTISYLARGMNPSDLKDRWALVSSDMKPDDSENWKHLGINVQQYPIEHANEHNKHQALTEFFVGWANHTKESLLHRSRKVRALAIGLPPESEADSDYIDYCLHHPQLAQDFCNTIRHPAWIGWMKAKGYFKALFVEPKDGLQIHERVIARWLSTFARRRHPELLLEIIQEHHQQLARSFTDILAHGVWSEEKTKPDSRFSTWVALLLSQGEGALSANIWGYLLQNCRLPKDVGVALRLFELLTTPQIKLEKHFDFSGIAANAAGSKSRRQSAKKVYYEIEWPDESRHWLSETWEKGFKQNLPLVAAPLVYLATTQLTVAHMLLKGVGRSTDYFDSLSWERSSIAPHEQNRDAHSETLSLLVDIARDVLNYWFETNPPRARIQIETWWSSDVPLLRRLAVHGVSVDTNLSADERIEWLLANDPVFRFGLKKEVFDILKVAYPSASGNVRRKLLRRIAEGFRGKIKRRLDAEISAYERFNALTWLQKADPHCSLVADEIAKIHKKHPNFKEREHAAFDHWHGDVGFIDPKEGFDIDQIISEPPSGFIERLLRASESASRRDRWDHLSLLATLFGKSKEWGQGFTEALAGNRNPSKEIWNAVFSAWKQSVKTRDDWIWILGVVEKLPESPEIFAGLANLISDIWRLEGEIKSDDAIIEKAAALMERAWKTCSQVEEDPDDSYQEWLTSAINHEGGSIGEFWVHYCSHLRQRAGKNWKGIPPSLKSKMVEAIRGKSRIKVYARIAMTPWMGFIFAWDKQFAVEHFLPLLDWQRDPVAAQQTWSVLLNYRRGTSLEMEQQLLPYYRQVADRMGLMLKEATEKTEQFKLDDHAARNLGFYLAGIAMKVIPNPLESGFLRDFLPRLTEQVRGALAKGIGDFLERTSPEKTGEIWNLWLREYVDLRLVGVPVALSVEETKEMADWPIYLGSVFPEAVQRITQMRLKEVYTHGIVDKLLKNPLLDSFPKESCGYINAIMRGEDYPHLDEEYKQLHSKFRLKISGSFEFKEFEELLYLRGWKK